MKQPRRKKRLLRNDRGSALLVSLMVIVGLSLLGLGFVAISSTETAIAKNQQAVTQTEAVAEAGAKLVVEWFQDPVWGQTTGGMPSNDGTVNTNLAAIKTTRVSGTDSGVYRGEVVEVTKGQVVQQIGQALILHDKDRLSRTPPVGDSVIVQYSNGRGAVKDAPLRARTRLMELGR